MTWTVRRMVMGDAADYREIRLEALRDAPAAFGGSFESAQRQSVAEFAARIEKNAMFVALEGDAWAGTAGFFREDGEKTRHRGTLFGLYVRPEYRSTGCGAALVDAVLAHAAEEVMQVHLAVGADNAPAMRTYSRAGFSVYGTDPRALRVGDRFIDEHLMVRFLEGTRKETENG